MRSDREANMDDHDHSDSKLVSTRLPADLHQLVEEAARAELLTNASWIRRAILAAVRESKGVHRADEVYRPIVSDEDDQSETPPASAELEIKDFRSRVEEGVDRSDT
jgi:hypothetical protein